ncbi:MAG: hypothetical protein KTR14_03125 [Vampirovibrio sp.]|nr:hypothetical protein [Vampirovibrio sp.]
MQKPLYLLICSLLILIVPLVHAAPFQQALPGYPYQFPKDHASHNNFKTEWWYYTGHLKTDAGKNYGYELTFFRSNPGIKNLPTKTNWALNNIYFAHFAVSDESGKKFFHTQKLGRGHSKMDAGLFGAETDKYHVWTQNWQATLDKDTHHLAAATPEFGINLDLTPAKPLVIHGKNGVSQKASCKGCASHYYSYSRLNTHGTLHINGKSHPVTGQSWMDHEFGSNQLTDEQTGWDWFSIQLDNNMELMLYILRQKDGGADPNSGGTLINANGKSRYVPLTEFNVIPIDEWKSPRSGGTYPMGWKINLPEENINLTITPAFPNQELHTQIPNGITYWEGACRVTGTVQGKKITGQAYVEMTGYAEQFRQDI